MRHLVVSATLAIGIALLSGCGQKGPLVLPARPASSTPASAASVATPAATAAVPAAAASAPAPATSTR